MRKPIIVLVCALLCPAMLGGCGREGVTPVDATASAPTQAIAVPDTTTATTKTNASTTSTTVTTHFKDSSPPPRLLEYKMDENGIFYREGPPPPVVDTRYSTIRIEFQYGSKDWMIQMWKGRYGLVMLGGEICVSPEEELVFQLDVYQHNFLTGKTTYLFTRGPESAAWYNGFVPGKFFEENRKDEIIVVGSITFPDEEMLRAFETPFAMAGFERGRPSETNPEKYSVKDNTLTFSWQTIDQDA